METCANIRPNLTQQLFHDSVNFKRELTNLLIVLVLSLNLKSANILLDDSHNPNKVCVVGLSRLNAQERSLTGNCGTRTVQWMEVIIKPFLKKIQIKFSVYITLSLFHQCQI